MSFWSGEKLTERLSEIVDDPDANKIDCAAYTLAIGPQVYVSPTEAAKTRAEKTIMELAEGEAFTIPPGQFALLLTEERVRVPSDAMAFISIRAKPKLRGLVNVSGFHVDPGYNGRLVFGVLNAGPKTIHLRRGDQCFLIWYVDLDRQSAIIKNEPGYETIPTELVNNIAGEFKTIEGLSKRMDKLTTEQNITRILAMVVIAGLASVLLRYVWPAPPSTSATTVSPTQSTSPFRQSATTAPPSRRNP